MKESEIQKSILDLLRLKRCLVFKHRNVGIFKQSTGTYIPLAFGEKGISDIIGCTPSGRFLAIEVKKPGGRVSPEQQEFINNVNRLGGIAILAFSLDDVINDPELKVQLGKVLEIGARQVRIVESLSCKPRACGNLNASHCSHTF